MILWQLFPRHKDTVTSAITRGKDKTVNERWGSESLTKSLVVWMNRGCSLCYREKGCTDLNLGWMWNCREQRESECWELRPWVRAGSGKSGSRGESDVYWAQQKGEIKCGTEPRAFTWQHLRFCQRYTSICDSFQLWLMTRSPHLPVPSQLGFQTGFKWPLYHGSLLLAMLNTLADACAWAVVRG